jgi:DNA-binding MarR family transcriptional regulator
MKSLDTTPAGGAFELFRTIGRIRAALVYDMEQEMARRGVALNFSQFLALKLLGDRSMAPGELARALNYNPGALTRLLDKLEVLGYLKRSPHPADRRSLQLELTTAGAAVRKRMIGCASAVAERGFAGISDRERRQLHRVLSTALDHMLAARR